MGFSPARMFQIYLKTFDVTKYSTITISAMVALADGAAHGVGAVGSGGIAEGCKETGVLREKFGIHQ